MKETIDWVCHVLGKFKKMKNWINRIINKLFRREVNEAIDTEDFFYDSIIIKEKIPEETQLKDKDFIEILYKGQSFWAIFMCPCGCKNVISLPLQETHNPYWKLKQSANGRPTLHPSIWQNKGCFSHFWIIDGKIKWCGNTGIEPWIAEPKYYKK